MISNGNAGRYTAAYYVLDLPFLFKRYEDMLDHLNSPSGQEATGVFEKDTGLKHLYLISFGSGRDIQTRTKQLKLPEDIKGLKIRVISTPVEMAIYKAWGANPTPVDWGQTYTALQQGVVDGMQSNIGPVWSGKFDEVVKHNIRLNYTSSFVQVFMSGPKFAALSELNKKAVMDSRRRRRSGRASIRPTRWRPISAISKSGEWKSITRLRKNMCNGPRSAKRSGRKWRSSRRARSTSSWRKEFSLPRNNRMLQNVGPLDRGDGVYRFAPA